MQLRYCITAQVNGNRKATVQVAPIITNNEAKSIPRLTRQSYQQAQSYPRHKQGTRLLAPSPTSTSTQHNCQGFKSVPTSCK
ncbi:unnamed protein product [Cuscuta campestris]|uniref:Uncharacterized protein n=1 Tax=Cuscuta campestris TaxID=132261 RepID=A0A484KAF7_9ASTE|nr:unnamed protein product [Cuscuta campestris]